MTQYEMGKQQHGPDLIIMKMHLIYHVQTGTTYHLLHQFINFRGLIYNTLNQQIIKQNTKNIFDLIIVHKNAAK